MTNNICIQNYLGNKGRCLLFSLPTIVIGVNQKNVMICNVCVIRRNIMQFAVAKLNM